MAYRNQTIRSLICASLLLFTSQAQAAPDSTRAIPFAFEENLGQLDDDARFAARGQGMVALLEDGGANLRMRRDDGSVWSLALEFVGQQSTAPRGERPEAGVANYTLGSDPADWQLGVRRFREVRYPGLYAGVDALFYGRDGALEYDLIVAPHADPTAVEMRFSGAEKLHVDAEGRLVVSSGSDQFRFEPPFAYQSLPNERRQIEAHYSLTPNGTVVFALGDYDRTSALVIDPVVLGYAAGFGGSGREEVRDMSRDDSGFIYLAGLSQSTTMLGASGNQGNAHAFVVKLTPDGSELVYATFYGGTGMDQAEGIAANAAGEAIVVGHTDSPVIPTPNAFRTTPIAAADIFVARFDAAGVPVYGSYFGTDGEDGVNGAGIDLGPGGIAYVTGRIDGEMMATLTTVDPFQATCGIAVCGYIAGFDTSASGPGSLVYSTYVKSNSDTAGHRVFVDGNGLIYLHGHTVGANGLVDPAHAFDPVYKAPERDHFILKLDPSRVLLAQRLYSTYFAGSGIEAENGTLVASDAGILWVAATTESNATDFPLKNAWKSNKPGNDSEFYVAKFDTTKTLAASLLWSTFLGGAGNEDTDLIGLAVNDTSEVFLAGNSFSGDFPVTNLVPGTPATGGLGYVVRLSADGQLLESTRIPAAAHIALEAAGAIWVAGKVLGTALTPPTGKVLLPVSGGDEDIFLARLDPVPNSVGIALSLEDSQDPVLPGADYGYQVRVSNFGVLDRDVSVTLTPGIGINLIAWPGQTCNFVGLDLECLIGTIPAGESESFTVLTRGSGSGPVTMNAVAAATPADADLTDNVAAQTTMIDPVPGPLTGALSRADFDVVAAIFDSGAFSLDTNQGVFGTGNETLDDGINLMTFDASIPVYIVDGPDFGGEVAFGVVERNDWTPSNADGADLQGQGFSTPSARVYVTVSKGGVVRLFTAAAFQPGVELASNRVGLAPDRAFELEIVGNTAFVRYDGMAVLAANPFIGFPGAPVGFSGDDGVISIGYGRDFLGSATINDGPPVTDQDGDGVLDSADNCPNAANGAGEAAVAGVGNQLDSNGNAVGDACECGDVSDDGFITVSDPSFYRTHLANPVGAPFSAVQLSKCNVIGRAQDCDLRDLAVLIRATQPVPLAPGIAPVCSAATGTP